ncbi:MAG: GNAT family N-acetyltransferase [Chloroflexi bacterium]|nr:MAG: GNAT family N-acetyltransferase [Chloroflexota bacterium]
MSGVEVGLLPAAAAEDGALVAGLTGLVNGAYALGEVGLWRDGAARVDHDRMAGLIRAGEVAVASAGRVVAGCVRVRRLDPRTGELGMLAAAAEHRGAGIGRLLVDFAEGVSAARGLDTMQLELLVPTGWAHPDKERLHAWYSRRGYRVVRLGALGEDYPHLVALLATPCVLRIYNRPLPPPSSRPEPRSAYCVD